MRAAITIILMGLRMFVQLVGSFALISLFIYGVYTLIVSSIAMGLMMIGASVVGGWVIQLLSGILLAAVIGTATIGVKEGGDT